MSKLEDASPEELAVIQKFCKHTGWIVDKSVEFLKDGESQPMHCENCGVTTELKIDWTKFLRDDESEFVYCNECGCRIKKGKEEKTPSGKLAHSKCIWGDDDSEW